MASDPASATSHRQVLSVHAAKTHLSKLIRDVLAGDEVVIERSGKPVVKIVAIESPSPRVFGSDENLFDLPEDFDAPLPSEFLKAFE